MTSTSDPGRTDAVEEDAVVGGTAEADVDGGDRGAGESELQVIEREPQVDHLLLAATDIARAALAEITEAATIGGLADHQAHEDHVLSLYFDCLLPGYPGWRWTATLSRLPESDEVNVLEVELLRGEDSVVSPDWVPWSERLAQYRDAQAKLSADEAEQAEAAAAELADEDDAEDDLLDNDHNDFDDELDGVDIDDDDFDESDDDTDDDESDDDFEEDSDDTDDSDDLENGTDEEE